MSPSKFNGTLKRNGRSQSSSSSSWSASQRSSYAWPRGTVLALLGAILAQAIVCQGARSYDNNDNNNDQQEDAYDRGELLVRQVRTEMASNNIGRDGEGDLRTVGGAYDASDNQLDSDNDHDGMAPSQPFRYARRNAIYLVEDKDYPRSLFEDYPRRVGQVSGITTLPTNDVVIFHRSARQWTAATFNQTTARIPAKEQENLIKNDTIMIIDGEDGSSVASFGSNLFYMPHSITSDSEGNLWVSDVARHQVMRLPVSSVRQAILAEDNVGAGNRDTSNNHKHQRKERNSTTTTTTTPKEPQIRHKVWPDIILGEAFVPGDDEAHFCQPSEIAVSSSGALVFVADGYCNGRVMVFTGAGKYLTSFGQEHNLTVVHALTLIEERNLLCVADRENGRILCYHAGLDGDYERLGELMRYVDYPLGRVFAITSVSKDHLLVSGNMVGTSRYDLTILNPFTNELKLVWISTDLLEPHSLATTRDRQAAYAADIAKTAYKKVYKFNIIKRND